jgi:hypothetical protein
LRDQPVGSVVQPENLQAAHLSAFAMRS